MASPSSSMPRPSYTPANTMCPLQPLHPRSSRATTFSIETEPIQPLCPTSTTSSTATSNSLDESGYIADSDSETTAPTTGFLSSSAARRNAFEDERSSLDEYSREHVVDMKRRMKEWHVASNWMQKGRVVNGPKLVWIRSGSASSSGSTTTDPSP